VVDSEPQKKGISLVGLMHKTHLTDAMSVSPGSPMQTKCDALQDAARCRRDAPPILGRLVKAMTRLPMREKINDKIVHASNTNKTHEEAVNTISRLWKTCEEEERKRKLAFRACKNCDVPSPASMTFS
jgi:hypothetical protein